MIMNERAGVKITHLATNETIVVGTTRSMVKNKALGIAVIKARLNAANEGLIKPEMDEDTVGTICPICEEGILTEKVEYTNNTVNGELFELPILFSVCSFCECEQADGFQINKNVEFRRTAAQMALDLIKNKEKKK